jgi:long-chain acyl-CoA synthetase
MDKLWLKNYPPGVAAEIDMKEFASLKDMLRHSCDRFADLPAYSNIGASLTYAELDQASRDFAAYLQDTLKLSIFQFRYEPEADLSR